MKKDKIKSVRIADYSYTLLDDKIAKYPLNQRDKSKLLWYKKGEISAEIFSKLPELLPAKSLLIFNNTRVIHARLLFQKSTGAHIEIFCLSPHYPKEYNLNFRQTQSCEWVCMIGNAKRWKARELLLELNVSVEKIVLRAERLSEEGQEQIVRFSWDNGEYSFSDILEIVGKLPIPPYLNRPAEAKDDETYQTIYSKIEGSVAAPTAGLHFTEGVMRSLHKKSVLTDDVTLHVGAGTFRPVKSETIGKHEMHTEFISVKKRVIEHLLSCRSAIVAVGTTSIRTIESLYYIGCQLENQDLKTIDNLFVGQWEPYNENLPKITPEKALSNILDYLHIHSSDTLYAHTQIMIVPGYVFKFTDLLITNFHQPQSTLLLLVAAFVGEAWHDIYNFALAHDFRFLSYGDSSLLWNKSK